MRLTLPALMAVGAAALSAHAEPAIPSTLVAQASAPVPAAKPSGACAGRLTRLSQTDPVRFKRLGDLPSGVLEHAVLRAIDGCPVREVLYQGRAVWVATPGVQSRRLR